MLYMYFKLWGSELSKALGSIANVGGSYYSVYFLEG